MSETPTTNAQGNIDTNASCIVLHSMEVHTYHVSRDKLEAIRNLMSAGSDELTIASILLSVAATSTATLATATFTSIIWSSCFWAGAIFGVVLGLFYLRKWPRTRRSATKIVDDILKAPEQSRKPIE